MIGPKSPAPTNPYQTPDISLQTPAKRILATSDSTLPATIGVWSLVCGISAAPSFFWGWMLTDGLYIPMILGVVTFIALYVVGDYVTRPFSFRRNVLVRRTLKIGYWSRIAISILFPVGMYLDVFAGMLAALLLGVMNSMETGGMAERSEGIVIAYVMTVTTGCIANVFLSLYMLAIYGIQQFYYFVSGHPKPILVDNEQRQSTTVEN